jgi:acid phosphatase
MRSKLKLGTLAIAVGGIGIVLSGAWMSGCTGTPGTQKGDPSGGNLGSAKVAFEAGPGIIINTISYTLTGPGGFSRNGSIDVSHSSTLGAIIGNIPSGNGYVLTANATATDGSTTCLGTSVPFNVMAATTVMVSFRLDCHEAPRTGSASITGTVNICPVIDSLGASPAEVLVGSSIALSSAAHDSDSGPAALTYAWTASSGTLSSASVPNPVFVCTATGPATVTLTVSDGDSTPGCPASSSVILSCTANPLQSDVQNIVVIYAENRSFDGLFGNFPGARGLGEVLDSTGNPTASYIPQKDRDGVTVLSKLPQTWGGATAAGNPTVVTQAQTDGLVNSPFGLESAFVPNGAPVLTTLDVTRDLAHRFFENQMEINGGTNDEYAAFEDAGGLTMGHWDSSHKSLYALAQQYVLADNFFEGAFGGSFLNHQYLICGCAPTVPSTFLTTNHASLNSLGSPNAKGVPQLATSATSPASALTGPPSFLTGNIAPLDYFGTGDGYRAVNTMQPPYQPSGNFPASGASDLRYADPSAATTLPPQTQTTMGDLLTVNGIGWAWYATSYDAALADGTEPAGSTHTVIYAPSTPRASPDFQTHHHPYNYYAAFDPATHAADRAAHLKDYNDMVSDIAAGSLPPVAWYKPTGAVNQHPGYANVDDGDAHIADLVSKLQAGPQWGHMVIVISYDEYGGQWDHVAPPKGDLIGPGTRIPAIIISPYAKSGTVDHTQNDSASTLRLITHRFALVPLPGLIARDTALVANGGTPMGDLTSALSLP